MKYSVKMKTIIKLITTVFFVVLMYSVEAQPPPPPGGSGGDGNTGDNSLGGNAPIGGELFIFMGLVAAYTGKKIYDLKLKEEKN